MAEVGEAHSTAVGYMEAAAAVVAAATVEAVAARFAAIEPVAVNARPGAGFDYDNSGPYVSPPVVIE